MKNYYPGPTPTAPTGRVVQIGKKVQRPLPPPGTDLLNWRSKPIEIPRVSSKRFCGACDVCCTVLDFEVEGVIDKKAGEPCPHLAPEGRCGNYDNRWSICKRFRCEWLWGEFGREDDRPDKSGLLFVKRIDHPLNATLDRECKVVPGTNKFVLMIAFEVRQGALATKEGKQVFQRFTRRHVGVGFARPYSPPLHIDGPAPILKFARQHEPTLANL